MQIKKITLVLFLGLIVGVGSFLRFANLDKNPSGFYVDEAAIGYNAFSILYTGRDEYGMKFPIFLRSFGDYKPPLYVYATIPFIKIFGLNIFAVRFLSALSGVISIVLIFLVVKEIFNSTCLSIISALVFAISPWSIFLSRAAFESNFATAIFLLSLLFFIYSKKRILYLIPAVLILGISTYAYQAQRLSSVIFLVGFLVFNYKNYLKYNHSKKILIWSVILFLVIQLPQFFLVSTPAFFLRQTGLFYEDSINNQVNKLSFIPPFLSWPLSFLREFSAKVFSYLSPRNLFFDTDPDLQRSIPELSVFYSWMVIPFVLGLFEILKSKQKTIVLLLLTTFVIAPSLTLDPFSTIRSFGLIIPLTIIIAFGLVNLFNTKFKLARLIIFVVFTFLTIVTLYRSLAVLQPNERAVNWSYGFDKLAQEIKKRPNEQFIIDDSRMKPVYIELAFFLKLPPKDLQKAVDQTIKNDYYMNSKWDSHYKLDQFETRAIDWRVDAYRDEYLVGDELSISQQQVKEHFLTEEFSILSPTGEIIFKGYKTNPQLKKQNNNEK